MLTTWTAGLRFGLAAAAWATGGGGLNGSVRWWGIFVGRRLRMPIRRRVMRIGVRRLAVRREGRRGGRHSGLSAGVLGGFWLPEVPEQRGWGVWRGDWRSGGV